MSKTTNHDLWEPQAIIETAAGRHPMAIKTMLLDEGIIMLDKEIDQKMAQDFSMQLRYLKSKEQDVTILISSPGGSVTAGLEMYDMIQSYPYELKTVATGTAASMAALLFTSAKKGKRFMFPHAKIMIHEVLVQQAPGGSATSIKEFADSLMKSRASMNDLLSKHTEQPRETIDKDTSYDHYFDAEEAIEYGLADAITTDY